MPLPEKIAEYLAYTFIQKNLPLKTKPELERIEYGITAFFIAAPKMALLFIAAFFLNYLINNFFVYFLTALVSYGIVRSFAWGIHMKKDWECLLISFLLLFGVVFAGIYLPLFLPLNILIYGIGTYLLYRYAPAQTEARPLRSKKLRRKLRIKLFITLCILFAAAVFFRGTPFSNIIVMAVLAESIIVTPFIYRILKLNPIKKEVVDQ